AAIPRVEAPRAGPAARPRPRAGAGGGMRPATAAAARRTTAPPRSARARRSRPLARSVRSELLAQVGRDVPVVTQRFVQPAGFRTVMPGRDLDERGVEVDADPLGLGHQRAADTTLPGAGIHDQ